MKFRIGIGEVDFRGRASGIGRPLKSKKGKKNELVHDKSLMFKSNSNFK